MTCNKTIPYPSPHNEDTSNDLRSFESSQRRVFPATIHPAWDVGFTLSCLRFSLSNTAARVAVSDFAGSFRKSQVWSKKFRKLSNKFKGICMDKSI
jgi:hypothetical protein